MKPSADARVADEPSGDGEAGVAPGAEGRGVVGEGDQAVIRDGDAMGVATEVGEDGLRARERGLAVDDPLLSVQPSEHSLEGPRVGDLGAGSAEVELPALMGAEQSATDDAAEELAHDGDGEEEAR